MRFLVLICLLSSLIGPSRSDWANSCHHCECKWMGGKKVANCSSAGLTQVPTNLNKEIQVLILDNNTITRLGENVFQDSLPNLQKIFIRHAGLRTIHPTAFYNLKILIEVDLSYNSITKLDKKTFDGNGRLKMVSFANNPIQVLESFQFPVLPHLKTIDFSFCQINAIQTSAFGNLGNSIEAIKLQGNKLKGLQ
ncbi:leucine-rich repeat-containing protein 26, partial [Eurytemora carolleeae]|uniref:leucine-rich repeat-containing protein 26 n=1 Tax=Eurytemora carolleeae TaxID=1294199 RepID=UPI000C760297